MSAVQLIQPDLFPAPFQPLEEFADSVDHLLITLLLTERCHYQCAHCLYSGSPFRPKAYVSDSVLAQVALALEKGTATQGTPILNLLGGEPTYDFDEFARVIRWVKSLQAGTFLLSMVTNGWWLGRLKSLTTFAEIMAPIWNPKDDEVRISISNTKWHDRFRSERLAKMIAGKNLGETLSNLSQWYPETEIAALSTSQRDAIAEIAEAAKRNEIYIQCRASETWNLVPMGRAEENGFGCPMRTCTPNDVSITVWPDGTIRHICEGPGKFIFAHIGDGIEKIWSLRADYVRRVHARLPCAEARAFLSPNPRCRTCRQFAGYWLDQVKPSLMSATV